MNQAQASYQAGYHPTKPMGSDAPESKSNKTGRSVLKQNLRVILKQESKRLDFIKTMPGRYQDIQTSEVNNT